MKVKRVLLLTSILLLLILTNTSAAATDTNPFSPGNAKTAFDKQDQEFKNYFVLAFGLFWLIVGSYIVVCLGGTASSYAAHKSGQYADPEKKSGSAVSMVGIVFIVLGLFICLSLVLPLFGFS